MDEFDDVYRAHARAVYRFLLKLSGDEHIAEECTQECFCRAYKNRRGYDGTCKLSVWLCQIAKNVYFDECRKKKPVPIDEDIPAGVSVEDLFCDRDASRYLHRILHTLPEPYKEVFTLKVFGELPYRDIAETFGKTENWARVVYHRARLKIIEAYERRG